MTKTEWKIIYRLYRIAIRESDKAWIDTILYGAGYVQIGPDIPDLIKHVPIEEIRQ